MTVFSKKMRLTKRIHCEWKAFDQYDWDDYKSEKSSRPILIEISREKISNMTATHGEKREEESGPGGDVGGEQVVDVDSSLKKKKQFQQNQQII